MLEYWVWLATVKNVSLRKKQELLEIYTDPEEIYIHEQSLSDFRDLKEAQTIVNKCKRLQIEIITMSDIRYPTPLKEISDPPLVLYCKGVMPDIDRHPVIAVVGTRRATAYGLEAAGKIAGQIAACGGILISGGAAGIDSSALKGAADCGGSVIAVLGCGVDIVYPRTNRRLFMDVEENGCLLSEYPPGTPPMQWMFPQRNRIISGMCNGVLVVEAPVKSGAMITARSALAQNRDVYVVPGNIDLETFKGSNSLLQEGAMAVFCGWDAVKNYAGQYPETVRENKLGEQRKRSVLPVKTLMPDKKDIDKEETTPYSVCVDHSQQSTQIPGLTRQEQLLLSKLDRRAVLLDDVAAMVGEPTADVLRTLTKMAMRGLVILHPGKLVSRK